METMKANRNLSLSFLVVFLLYLFGIVDKCNASKMYDTLIIFHYHDIGFTVHVRVAYLYIESHPDAEEFWWTITCPAMRYVFLSLYHRSSNYSARKNIYKSSISLGTKKTNLLTDLAH